MSQENPKPTSHAAGASVDTWALAITIAAGALGILSGYCIFLTWQTKAEEQQGWLFLVGLLIAAMVAFVTEYFRDIIKEGHASVVEPGGAGRVVGEGGHDSTGRAGDVAGVLDDGWPAGDVGAAKAAR